jgi:hypothetical protein
MDAVLKQKWVEALRSGKFEQGTGHLTNKGCYCCLGVLCTVAGATWTDIEIDEDDGDGFVTPHSYTNVPVLDGELLSNGQDEELGLAGLQKFGLDTTAHGVLIQMNDGWKETPQHSFAQIADYIEENL